MDEYENEQVSDKFCVLYLVNALVEGAFCNFKC